MRVIQGFLIILMSVASPAWSSVSSDCKNVFDRGWSLDVAETGVLLSELERWGFPNFLFNSENLSLEVYSTSRRFKTFKNNFPNDFTSSHLGLNKEAFDRVTDISHLRRFIYNFVKELSSRDSMSGSYRFLMQTALAVRFFAEDFVGDSKNFSVFLTKEGYPRTLLIIAKALNNDLKKESGTHIIAIYLKNQI